MNLLLAKYQNPLEYFLYLTKPWVQFYLNFVECLLLKISTLIYSYLMNIIIFTLIGVFF